MICYIALEQCSWYDNLMVQGKDKFEKISKEEKISLMFDLINSFRIVRSPLETALFLQDLLTAKEIRNLSIRLRIAKLLLVGKNQREIIDELHTSFATINKVKVWINQGGDGFKNVIGKLPLKWDIPKKLPRGPIEYHLPQTLIALAQYGVARNQDKKVMKFVQAIDDKKELDRGLQKIFDEYYKERALEQKSLVAKSKFKEKIKRPE